MDDPPHLVRPTITGFRTLEMGCDSTGVVPAAGGPCLSATVDVKGAGHGIGQRIPERRGEIVRHEVDEGCGAE